MNKVIRKNTIKCIFERTSQKPLAIEIHTWIKDILLLRADDLEAIQLDGSQHAVYIKINEGKSAIDIIDRFKGEARFTHRDGTISTVALVPAEMGYKTVRILNIPLEVSNQSIAAHLQSYGKILQISDEYWADSYFFKVKNGIRIVKIEMSANIPSYIMISGFRSLILYDGQPRTCSNCNASDHLRADCMVRKPAHRQVTNNNNSSWSDIVASMPLNPANRLRVPETSSISTSSIPIDKPTGTVVVEQVSDEELASSQADAMIVDTSSADSKKRQTSDSDSENKLSGNAKRRPRDGTAQAIKGKALPKDKPKVDIAKMKQSIKEKLNLNPEHLVTSHNLHRSKSNQSLSDPPSSQLDLCDPSLDWSEG
jgi:hypothetical protein